MQRQFSFTYNAHRGHAIYVKHTSIIQFHNTAANHCSTCVMWKMKTLRASSTSGGMFFFSFFSRLYVSIYELCASITLGKHIPVHLQLINTDRKEKYCMDNKGCRVTACFFVFVSLKIFQKIKGMLSIFSTPTCFMFIQLRLIYTVSSATIHCSSGDLSLLDTSSDQTKTHKQAGLRN